MTTPKTIQPNTGQNYYRVTVIRQDSHAFGHAKYKVKVTAVHNDMGWEDYTYMLFRWNAKRVARKLIKENEPHEVKQDVTVKEFVL